MAQRYSIQESMQGLQQGEQVIQENAFKLKDEEINLLQKQAEMKRQEKFQKILPSILGQPATPEEAATKTAMAAFEAGLPVEAGKILDTAAQAFERMGKADEAKHKIVMESLDKTASLLGPIPDNADPNDQNVQAQWHETAVRIIADNPNLPPGTLKLLNGPYSHQSAQILKTRVMSAKDEAEVRFKDAQAKRQEAAAERDRVYTEKVIPSIVKKNEAASVAKEKVGVSDTPKAAELKAIKAQVGLTKTFQNDTDEDAYAADVVTVQKRLMKEGLTPDRALTGAIKQVDRDMAGKYSGKWKGRAAPKQEGRSPDNPKKVTDPKNTTYQEGYWYDINGQPYFYIGLDDAGKKLFKTKAEVAAPRGQ